MVGGLFGRHWRRAAWAVWNTGEIQPLSGGSHEFDVSGVYARQAFGIGAEHIERFGVDFVRLVA